MPAPPAKKTRAKSSNRSGGVDAPQKEKECATISMVVDKGNCLSSVTRIKGYPWRLRLFKSRSGYWELSVRCEKSMEAELWKCEAIIDFQNYKQTLKFESNAKESQEHSIGAYLGEGTQVEVKITPADDGNKWRCRPILSSFAPRDGCLVIEDTKLYVNKESLASQSSFFDRLFNGNFKEKNMAEIPIGDVSPEEFTNLMKMVYGENNASAVDGLLTGENVDRILELADRFELEIVKDGVANVLLYSTSSFSIHERLFIADKHGLSKCKDEIILLYDNKQLKELCKAPEYGQLSMDTKDSLFKRSCELLP